MRVEYVQARVWTSLRFIRVDSLYCSLIYLFTRMRITSHTHGAATAVWPAASPFGQ